MIRHVKFGLLAVALFAFPIFASAQMRTATARSVWHPMQTARPAVAHATVPPTRPMIMRVPLVSSTRHGQTSGASMRSASVISVSPNGTVGFFPTATSFDLNQLLNNVPGLGFDFSHMAALNGNLGERAFIDPVTQQSIALAEQLSRTVPAFTGGFIPFWGGYGGYSEPVVEEEQPQAQPQPSIIVLQQPVASAATAPHAAPSSEPNVQEQPLPDVGEFTLVLRDGSKIKAVAFTRQNDQIVYITSDGVRNSFSVSDLDATATEQLNQQHGTPLHLSL